MKVSVLLPVHDAAATLAACLRSIARQTERDFECVIVDDGSRDDSAAIAEAWCRRDARFVLLRRAHQGLVPALNAGIAACRAPLVARMDADDVMHRERLRLQCEALAGDLDFAGTHVRFFPRPPSAGTLRYERWLNSLASAGDVARDAYVECPLAHPSWMLRRDILEGLGYRDGGWPEDWDLLQRALAAGHRIGVVPKRLLGWRDHPGRMSRTHPAFALEAFTACRAHYLAMRFLAAESQYVLWGYGETGKALRKALAAHGKTPAAIVELHPGRLGQRIFGAPVIAPEALRGRRDKIVASVAGAEPRQLIRSALHGWGFCEGRDFVCAA